MFQFIPPEITLGSFTVIGTLTGYIWNEQNKKIKDLKKKQNDLPCNIVCNKIGVIQNDIRWIKEKLTQ